MKKYNILKKTILLLAPMLLWSTPNNPSNLILSPSLTTVAISWQDNANNETGFKIFRDNEQITLLPPNSTSYIDNGLLSKHTYTYTIKATDDDIPDTDSVQSKIQASAFLSRATFGTRVEDIDLLYDDGAGSYHNWIETQESKAPTKFISWMQNYFGTEDLINVNLDDGANAFYQAWYSIVPNSEDQLRQRVALALSEIFVISIKTQVRPISAADYYDMLLEDAFVNFRTLLEDVTLHPAMGKYLSMWGNDKGRTNENGVKTHADENYAREVMQLFSIGLVQLHLNGEVKLSEGKPIPTYTQHDVEEFAKVYTGWTTDNGHLFDGAESFQTYTSPMVNYAEYHDSSEKTFSATFSSAYNTAQSIPANLTAEEDLAHALDLIFLHPNVGPFIAKALIQRLVTSNPDPAYIQRVASIFNNNGLGIRGDMKAVISAILTDKEVLHKEERVAPNSFGKLREQLIMIASLLRTFHASGDPTVEDYIYYDFVGLGDYMLHSKALDSPSVFNYYQPDFKPSGILKNNNLNAPEFQLIPPLRVEGFASAIMQLLQLTSFDITPKIFYDFSQQRQLLSEDDGSQKLVDHLNLLMMANQMSEGLKSRLVAYIDRIKQENIQKNLDNLVEQVVALIMLSSEYQIKR